MVEIAQRRNNCRKDLSRESCACGKTTMTSEISLTKSDYSKPFR